MISKSILKVGKSDLIKKVAEMATTLTPEEQGALGYLMELIGKTLKDATVDRLQESFTIGHIKATFVKESNGEKPDFSADEKWLKLSARLKEYEAKNASKMPKKPDNKKAHFRFTYTG